MERMSDTRMEFFVNGLRARGTVEDMELLGEIIRGRQAEEVLTGRLFDFLEKYHPQDTDAKIGRLEQEIAELRGEIARLRETIRKIQVVYVDLEVERNRFKEENNELRSVIEREGYKPVDPRQGSGRL